MTSTMLSTIPTSPTGTTGVTEPDGRFAVRTHRDDVGDLPSALRSEWIKLSTLRTNKVVLAVAAGIAGLVAFALAMSSTDPSMTASELNIYPLPLVATLAVVTGILMFTGEAQHGTFAVTLTARPARWVIVSAKTTMALAAGYAGSVLGGVDAGEASALVSRTLWALLYTSLAAVIGLGVGMIVRHSAGAISGLLMWSFVIESLFAPALPDGVVHFLPFSAGYRLLDAGEHFEPPVVIADQLARSQYALVFGGWAVILLTVGTILMYRRDHH